MMFNLQKAGWCTPTVLAAIIAVITIFGMLLQILNKKHQSKKKEKDMILVFLVAIFLKLAVIALLFYLCTQRQVMAAWYVFGFLYILPILALFIGMASYAYYEGKKKAYERD